MRGGLSSPRPDGQGIVKCWNMTTNSEMELAGHQGNVYCLAAGSNMLFSGGFDKTIRVYSYDAAAGAFAPSATMQAHEQAVLVLEVVEGLLFSGGAEGHIKVWDLAQGACVQDIAAHTGHLVMELVFWEHHLLSCAMDGKVKVWASNAASWASPNFQLLQTFPPDAPGGGDVFSRRQTAAGDETPLVSICGCADTAGQPVLLASQNDSKVNLLALPSFQRRGECFLPSDQYARALAYGPGGMFFTGDSGGVVKCWRFATA
jgi:WD40 repeat protein